MQSERDRQTETEREAGLSPSFVFFKKKQNKKHKTARDSSDVAAAGTDS